MPPASNAVSTYVQDLLFAGHMPILPRRRTLLSGDGARTRGAVLGRTATAAAVAAAVAAAGNTGNGALNLAATPFDGKVKEGLYRITFIEPTANLGTFIVEDPDGNMLPRAGVVGTQFAGGHLVFTIADGAADFVAGDSFTVAVSAVVYKYKRAVAAAADGSNAPVVILAEDADSSGGDVECLVYERGDFNENALNFGAGHTAATVRAPLRKRDITLVSIQPA